MKADGYWKESVDKHSGKRYYFHTKTKETKWSKPDEYLAKSGKFKRRKSASARPAKSRRHKGPINTADPLSDVEEPEGGNEEIVSDAEAEVAEEETREVDAKTQSDDKPKRSGSKRHPPTVVKDKAAAQAAIQENRAWVAEYDSSRHKTYYWNATTKSEWVSRVGLREALIW